MKDASNELRCPDCKQVFSHTSSLSRHKSSQCGALKSFVCNSCDRQFQRKDSLARHCNDGCKKLKEKKETQCLICFKENQSNWHLKRHLETCKQKCRLCKKKIDGSLEEHVCEIIQVKIPQKRKKASSDDAEDSNRLEYEIPSDFWDLVDLAMILQTEWDDTSSDVDFNVTEVSYTVFIRNSFTRKSWEIYEIRIECVSVDMRFFSEFPTGEF